MKRGFRMLMAALCSVVFLCGFSVTAYAGGGDEVMDYETEPVVETEPATEPEPAPTIEPGAGFAEEGNLVTRDLLYDKNTNKQFISVQTSGGNTFYIVIDYDKPTDEDGDQYETYFFSIVDEADLLAAMESAGVELPACTCKEKCVVGAINTDCPVCSVNMGECAGVTPEPDPEPTTEPEPEEAAKKNGAGPLILVLAIFAVGGGAGWYFKIYRPQHQQAAAPEDDYEEEMDAYNDFEDDGPPWDEDDPEPGEEDEA